MDHPYRAALVVSDERRVVVAEAEPAPAGVRVRAWTDGTTRLRVRPRQLRARAAFGAIALGSAGLGVISPVADIGVPLALFAVSSVLALRGFVGEEIIVTRAAVARRRPWRRLELHPLADVTTALLSGSGEAARLDLQIGRERVPLAEGLGYDEATLRWIAQRLRRALDHARASP